MNGNKKEMQRRSFVTCECHTSSRDSSAGLVVTRTDDDALSDEAVVRDDEAVFSGVRSLLLLTRTTLLGLD